MVAPLALTTPPPLPPPAADGDAATQLEALRSQLLEHVLPLLDGYIWQRDRFNLQLSTQRQAPWQRARSSGTRRRDAVAAPANGSMPPHLWGSVSFGDNIEDEWLVVWLLLELTHAFPVTARWAGWCTALQQVHLQPWQPSHAQVLRCITPRMPAVASACCRVWDNDGEFLLIEAAYGLPRWLKPETAQNRLWLHGGVVHLVPLPRFAGGCTTAGRQLEELLWYSWWTSRPPCFFLPEAHLRFPHPLLSGDPLLGATPSLAQALAAVRGSEMDTAAPPKLQVRAGRVPLGFFAILLQAWQAAATAKENTFPCSLPLPHQIPAAPRRQRWLPAWPATPPAPCSRCMSRTRWCPPPWRTCYARSRSCWRQRWRLFTTETPMTSR